MGTDDDPEPDATSDGHDPGTLEDDSLSGRGRMFKFAKRLMDPKDLAEDTMGVLSAVWSTSDKAKTEAVRLMAREFRSYLKELRLKEDLLKLATSHSLEISIHLKPLGSPPEAPEAPPSPPTPRDPK